MAFPLIPAIIAACGALAGAVIVVAILKWAVIVDWFRGKRRLKESDKANIAFTIKNAQETGNFNVVQGIFNTDSGEVLDGQKYEAKQLSEELDEAHKGKDLVIYE
jgi:hypothetical protein